MHLANLTMASRRSIAALTALILFTTTIQAQDNSPYSRYGLGDIVPNQNIISRSLGGVAAGYSDRQSINLTNPAALGNLSLTTFDVGSEVDIHTLKSNNSPEKYTSRNLNISYLQLGFPLYNGKLNKRKPNSLVQWGGSFGLKPVTRISYKIQEESRLPGFDSVATIYEGSGGLNAVNLSTGLRINNFSLGAAFGFSFGNKDFSSRRVFRNDTIPYYASTSENQSNFSGASLTLGAQYAIKLKQDTGKLGKFSTLIIGAYSNLKQNLNGNRDILNASFIYDGNGAPRIVDTVSYVKGRKGSVNVPANYGLGFTYANNIWLVGMDYTFANWNSFSYYGQKDDAVADNWSVKAGFQYSRAQVAPAGSKYWNYVTYRVGAFYGNDYIKVTNNRPDFGASLGAGFPLTVSTGYRRDFVTLNTGFDYNSRGNKNSASFRENIVRFNFGVTMNAQWFMKYKYQ